MVYMLYSRLLTRRDNSICFYLEHIVVSMNRQEIYTFGALGHIVLMYSQKKKPTQKTTFDQCEDLWEIPKRCAF